MFNRCIALFSFIPFIYAIHLQPFIPSLLDTALSTKLPPSTHATLTTLSQVYSAPLRIKNDFDLQNVTSGSYLLDIHCHAFSFSPLRVDVWEGAGEDSAVNVRVWGTYRGNEWDNKGEEILVGISGQGENRRYSFAVQMLAPKKYIMKLPGFSPLNMLKNPMIIMAGLTMIIVFGMPYLMENLDPELKAEFEEQQKQPAITAGNANPLQNFDAAAWLAGSSKTETKA